MSENRELDRLEAKFEAVCSKLDTVLVLLGRIEPWLDEAPKARDKVQSLEVEVSTQKTQLNDVREDMKTEKVQAFWKGLLTSALAGAASFAASMIIPHK